MQMHTQKHKHQFDYYGTICNQSEQLKGPRTASMANYTFPNSLVSKYENTKGEKARFFHAFLQRDFCLHTDHISSPTQGDWKPLEEGLVCVVSLDSNYSNFKIVTKPMITENYSIIDFLRGRWQNERRFPRMQDCCIKFHTIAASF